jgi:hypothetical protein
MLFVGKNSLARAGRYGGENAFFIRGAFAINNAQCHPIRSFHSGAKTIRFFNIFLKRLS